MTPDEEKQQILTTEKLQISFYAKYRIKELINYQNSRQLIFVRHGDTTKESFSPHCTFTN